MGPPATVPWLTILPPAPPGKVRRLGGRPYPLGEPGVRLFAKSRHAIWHGVRALDLRDGDEVLIHAYNCGAEVEALLRAGLVCRFFGRAGGLEPDEDELDTLLTGRTRLLYLIHVLGFPQDSAFWRRWCDQRGLLLFEDAAQAWLADVGGRPVGSFGDAAVFSLYKTIGIPDGSALVVHSQTPTSAPTAPLRPADLADALGKWLGAHPSPLARAATAPFKARHLRRSAGGSEAASEERFDLGDPLSPLRGLSRLLVARLADASTAERRRANFRALAAQLEDLLPEPFRLLPDGASPFAFPVERRPGLVERLQREGVLTPTLWRRPHPAISAGRFPQVERLRESLVALPVHQELRRSDLERMWRAALG